MHQLISYPSCSYYRYFWLYFGGTMGLQLTPLFTFLWIHRKLNHIVKEFQNQFNGDADVRNFAATQARIFLDNKKKHRSALIKHRLVVIYSWLVHIACSILLFYVQDARYSTFFIDFPNFELMNNCYTAVLQSEFKKLWKWNNQSGIF